jgi:hypothetical protein
MEEHWLKTGYWGRVLPKGVEVTGEWRRLHYEVQLCDLYSLPNIIRVIKSRRMRWVGRVVRIGDWRGAYRISVGRHKGKRPLGRPRRRWENIKMDIQEIAWAWSELIWLSIRTNGGILRTR